MTCRLHGFSRSGNAFKVALLPQSLQRPRTAVPLRFADIAACCPAMARWLDRVRQVRGWKPPCQMLPGEQVAPRC